MLLETSPAVYCGKFSAVYRKKQHKLPAHELSHKFLDMGAGVLQKLSSVCYIFILPNTQNALMLRPLSLLLRIICVQCASRHSAAISLVFMLLILLFVLISHLWFFKFFVVSVSAFVWVNLCDVDFVAYV